MTTMTTVSTMSAACPEDSEDAAPRAHALTFPELTPPAGGVAAPAILDNINPLHQIRTRLTVAVGEVELSVGELLAAQEHQVIRLDRTIGQAVDLLLEGRVVARGQLVAVDEHFAVRITELPAPLTI